MLANTDMSVVLVFELFIFPFHGIFGQGRGGFALKNHSWQKKPNKINLLISEFLMINLLLTVSVFLSFLKYFVSIVGVPIKI